MKPFLTVITLLLCACLTQGFTEKDNTLKKSSCTATVIYSFHQFGGNGLYYRIYVDGVMVVNGSNEDRGGSFEVAPGSRIEVEAGFMFTSSWFEAYFVDYYPDGREETMLYETDNYSVDYDFTAEDGHIYELDAGN